jgi:ribonuclease P protein subunit RPR2
VVKKHGNFKTLAQDIARERVDILFNEAREAAHKPGQNEIFSRRYVFMARRLAMRIREPLPLQYRRACCKKCNEILIPGLTCRVRLQGTGKNAHVAVTCLHCGNITRYHTKRRSQAGGAREP